MLAPTTQRKSRHTDVAYFKTLFHQIRVHRYGINYHWIAQT